MKWYIAALFFTALLLVLISIWIMQGREIFTKDKTQVVTIVKDELFGAETEKIEWIDDFHLGLLPGNTDSIANLFCSVTIPGGILFVAAIGCFYTAKRLNRNSLQ